MVLKVLSDKWTRNECLDPSLCEDVRVANTTELEDLWRLDAARANDDFFGRERRRRLFFVNKLYTSGRPGCIILLENYLFDERFGQYDEICSLSVRMIIRRRRGRSSAGLGIDGAQICPGAHVRSRHVRLVVGHT